MNPFRKSREFSLYRQLVFGDRARSAEQPLPPAHGAGSAANHTHAPSSDDAAAHDDSETV